MVNVFKHSNFLSSRVITGVEYNSSDESYAYCQIKNYYGSISIKKEGTSILTIEELNNKIGKNKSIPFSPNPPVCLTITGKQILIKEVIADYEEEENILLQKALPGAKPNDFYIQKYWNQNSWILSVIKVDKLNEILEELKITGLDCLEVTLGPLTVFNIFGENQQEINLPNCNLSKIGSEYQIYSEENKVGRSIQIGDEEINFHQIISFSAGLNFFSKNDGLEQVENKGLNKTNEEVKFHIYQIALLRLFFVLVLFMWVTNYFLSLNYQNALIDLKDITGEQQTELKIYEQNKRDFDQKRSILSATGVLSSNNYSYYADRVAILVPQSISLLTLEIGLLENRIKEDEKLKINKKLASIRGVSSKTIELKEFLLKLEQEDWVNESVIQSYELDNRENPGLFEIKIMLNE